MRVFARFWGADRRLVHRLHALSALDPEFEAVIRHRNERRREALRVLVRRMAQNDGRLAGHQVGRIVDVLWAVISFEMFHAIAGEAQSFDEVVPQIVALARAALELGADASG